jgi:hypothetical protein
MGYAGSNGLPLILPTISMAVGDVLHFRPYELKQNFHPQDMLVPYQTGVLCPVTRLQQLLVESFQQGQPITQYLCRPLAPDHKRFLEASLSVAAFESDVDSHFSAAGVTYHATLHGGRRGSLQTMHQAGQPLAAVGEKAQIKTVRIQELYVNPQGHLPSRLPKGPRPSKKARAFKQGARLECG